VSDRDISRRFVIVYHVWPIDSREDEASAVARKQQLQERQRSSWMERWPLHGCDNSAVWRVVDTGLRVAADVARD